MQKEPIALYIFRFVLGFFLFAFMGMLYWSSTLIEDRLTRIEIAMSVMKNDLQTMRQEAEKGRNELKNLLSSQEGPLRSHLESSGSLREEALPKAKHPIIGSKEGSDIASSKNLLVADPFYETTLPKMLGERFVASGIQHRATLGKPDNLHPFSNFADIASWQNLCTVAVAQGAFGKYETLSPDMATRLEERIGANGVPEFWVFLRSDVYWHPLESSFFSQPLASHFLKKHPVTAHDYKFFFDAIMNPHVQLTGAVASRNFLNGIEDVEVIDDQTFVVRWKSKLIADETGKLVPRIKYAARQLTGSLKPLAGFVYKYFADGEKIIEDDSAKDSYRTNFVWAQNFSEHWAKNIIPSCGPWIFAGMTDRAIQFERNSDFYAPYAALTQSIEVALKDSPENVWQSFKSNQLDSYNLQPDQQLEYGDFLKSQSYAEQLQSGDGIKRLDYLRQIYTYIGWNSAKPYFSSAKVRTALTMAIDRTRLIDQVLNGQGIEISCPFYRYSPSYDESIAPLPFDPQQARRLLEEEGWFDSDGDGIIDKEIDGKRVPFRFSLTYYVKNPTAKSICDFVATALKQLGIVCQLSGVDVADLSSSFDDKSFDALFMAWMLSAPPDDPRQLWHSSGAKEKGSSNAVGFANAEIDAIIDALDYESDEKKRVALYHRFDAIWFSEQPYTLLYTPKVALLYRDYLKGVFIPADHQDLVPGADVATPYPSVFWLAPRQAGAEGGIKQQEDDV